MSDTAFRLLVYMCLRSLDETSAKGQAGRHSFMRRAELAKGLGRDMPESKPGPGAALEDIRLWKKHDQAVTRALKELVELGAVHRVASGRKGWTATYLICVNPWCPHVQTGEAQAA
ncbi:hypothetical protein [Curtobacterium sp. MCSS17_015]|uniref:hypothetical protein n=1 Tax=Curtobacterium sp. MCSS17_015 TaxID=2175666 RepID=UPI000DA75E74|nr:hypothetical protein [Curtobacterium sp. MCSS17_015]WIB25778.1 hypothetical protein DEJ18_12065 [Curtobacterium sp. MCSS17_015]